MKSDYLFCIDSDGCAMDTMTYKHELFFGPIAADVFGINNKEEFLKKWNQVNLFSETRGVNRFTGLVMCLEWASTEDIDDLVFWANQTSELSNLSLKKEIKKNSASSLKKALEWSERVNQSLESVEGLDQPFKLVKESLRYLKSRGKVMIVSSANKEAVINEWNRHNLMPWVDKVACQEKGKKEDIIHQELAEGWDNNKLLMIGDSPGDLNAAKSNAVAFYPVLVGKEETSWRLLKDSIATDFVEGKYLEMESDFIKKFWNNLDNK